MQRFLMSADAPIRLGCDERGHVLYLARAHVDNNCQVEDIQDEEDSRDVHDHDLDGDSPSQEKEGQVRRYGIVCEGRFREFSSLRMVQRRQVVTSFKHADHCQHACISRASGSAGPLGYTAFSCTVVSTVEAASTQSAVSLRGLANDGLDADSGHMCMAFVLFRLYHNGYTLLDIPAYTLIITQQIKIWHGPSLLDLVVHSRNSDAPVGHV